MRKNIFKYSVKIMILKYLISYEKSAIQIISLISLPWISQHVCTLLTCPIFRTMVSIKGRNLTAWVRSLSSASGNCQNWICHRAPLKTKYFHLSNQQLWLGQKKPFHPFDFCGLAFAKHSDTIHGLCLWHLGNLSARNCVQNCPVFKIRWILCGLKWTCGQFI